MCELRTAILVADEDYPSRFDSARSYRRLQREAEGMREAEDP